MVPAAAAGARSIIKQFASSAVSEDGKPRSSSQTIAVGSEARRDHDCTSDVDM